MCSKKFAVVHFPEEKTVEVVPYKWIDLESNECAYPSGPKVGLLRRNPNSRPLSTWEKYPIKLKYTTDSFTKADEQAENQKFTSQVDSSDESEEDLRASRKRRPKRQYSPPDFTQRKPSIHQIKKKVTSIPLTNVYAESESEDDTRGAADCRVEPTVDDPAFPEADNYDEILGLQSQRTWPDTPRSSHLNNSQAHSAPTSPIESLQPFQSTEPGFSQQLQNFQVKVFGMFHSIQSELQVIRCNTHRSSGSIVECPFNIPIVSTTSLTKVNEELIERSVKRNFEAWAASIGGFDYKSHTRRVLQSTFAHDLSLKINLTGRNGKLSFRLMKIGESIIAAVASSRDVEKHEVETVCKEWFRCSSDHHGGRESRRKKTRTQ